MTARFPGFPAEGLKFLRQLKRNNDREWFQARKDKFEKYLRDPMLELCASLNEDLAKFAPDYVMEPAKAIFRIYRDTRFSADKTPYKTHLAAVFTHRLLPRNYGSGFYLHLETERVGAGGGIYRPDAARLKMMRGHMAEHHGEYADAMRRARASKITGEFEGHEMKRPPKGWEADHPAAELLRCRSLFFFDEMPAEAALEPGFGKEVARRFRAVSNFVQLVDGAFLGKTADPFRFTAETGIGYVD